MAHVETIAEPMLDPTSAFSAVCTGHRSSILIQYGE